MTRNASRKRKTRDAAASQGVSYTDALRQMQGADPNPPGEQHPLQLDLGTFVAEEGGTQERATWAPNPQNSRVMIDGTQGGGTLLLEVAVVQAAHNAGLPVLAIGPFSEDYREAAPEAEVFRIGNEGMAGGYLEAPQAAKAVEDFIHARSDWRLLLAHLQRPLEDEDGQKVWDRGFFDEPQRLTAPERKAVRRITELLAVAGSPAVRHPGLLMAGVVTDDLNDALLYPPTSYTTRLSAALRLEYHQPVGFSSPLPRLEDCLPRWHTVISRLDDRARGNPFWYGMNPKDGRVVMGSINGGDTHAILLHDPPLETMPGWSLTRENLLEADREDYGA